MALLKFYFAPGSSSMAAHIALHEAGVAFDPRPVSFARRETHEPWFLALNPEGKVPVLVVDGRPLTEVAGILWYLAKSHPEAGLLTADEAWAVSWMSFRLHRARGVSPRHRRCALRLGDRRTAAGKRRVGARRVLHRRHPPLQTILALPGTHPWRCRGLSGSRCALRPDDGARGRQAHHRGRGGDRLRAAAVEADANALLGVVRVL